MLKNKLLYLSFILLSTLFVSACSEKENTTKPNRKVAVTIDIKTLDDLITLFEQHDYTKKSWDAGSRAVPRITFAKVDKRWQETSKKLPVKLKKGIFFRLMAPLILMSNESILAERAIVKSASLSDPKLIALANKYRLFKKGETKKHTLTQEQRTILLSRVDIISPSLALAQAAEESGWGTSRFTSEGNAFFGQWDFSGAGMTPKQQRKELGNYGLARFDSPLASVEGYMLNINTSFAYEKLRNLRRELRSNDQPITGVALASTLDKYSERGQAYIDGLKSMIEYNNLQQVDNAHLMNNPLIHLE